jgi:hypothetical protein
MLDEAYLKEIGLWPRWRLRAAQDPVTQRFVAEAASPRYGADESTVVNKS